MEGVDEKGTFVKGRKKTGGRQKGTPNKAGVKTKDTIAAIVDGNVEKAQKMLDKIQDPKDFMYVFIKLAEFVVPKQSAIKLNDQRQSDLRSELSEMENKEK